MICIFNAKAKPGNLTGFQWRRVLLPNHAAATASGEIVVCCVDDSKCRCGHSRIVCGVGSTVHSGQINFAHHGFRKAGTAHNVDGFIEAWAP
jgi:hypothetical protein